MAVNADEVREKLNLDLTSHFESCPARKKTFKERQYE